ncbi:MAG: 30S ribosomal protein S13 [Rickettsiales bacterium]
MNQNVIVAGVVLPSNKRIIIALQSVYGVGPYIAKNICKTCNINENKKTIELTEEDIVNIRTEVEKIVVGDDLRSQTAMYISRLNSIGCRRALRMQKGLPSRGQRSKTNAKTSRKMRGLFFQGASISGSLTNTKNNKNTKGGKNTKGNKNNTKKKK